MHPSLSSPQSCLSCFIPCMFSHPNRDGWLPASGVLAQQKLLNSHTKLKEFKFSLTHLAWLKIKEALKVDSLTSLIKKCHLYFIIPCFTVNVHFWIKNLHYIFKYLSFRKQTNKTSTSTQLNIQHACQKKNYQFCHLLSRQPVATYIRRKRFFQVREQSQWVLHQVELYIIYTTPPLLLKREWPAWEKHYRSAGQMPLNRCNSKDK